MSFSIDRYKEESKKVDTTGIAWDEVTAHPLSKGDLFCLHYMMDIENHVPLYLSHLLVTRACMDPILTAFLACWNYEELWHGENIGRWLNLYGIEFDTQERIANVRANLGFQNSVSILSTMAGSWLLKDFSAVYLSIGAINELSTLTGYEALIRKSGHPVLKDLLSRIIKDERRHFAFYYNSAKEWLADNEAAQRFDRFMLNRVWVPVGKGVKNQEEVDALALYLFDDEQGEEDLLAIDEKIGALAARDEIALAELYERYGGLAYSLAWRILGDSGRAEDVVQEAFLKLWNGAGRFDQSRGSLRAWLTTAVRNRSIDLLRGRSLQDRRALALRTDVVAGGAGPEEQAASALEREAVRAALASLPEEQRETVFLAYFGGFTQAEIAELGGVPLSTIKGRM